MSIDFNQKFFRFDDALPVLSATTLISRLIALQERQLDSYDDNEYNGIEYNGIKYNGIKYNEIEINADIMYFHYASAFFCLFLALIGNRRTKDFPFNLFCKYVINDVWRIDGSFQDFSEEQRNIFYNFWYDSNQNINSYIEVFEPYLLYEDVDLLNYSDYDLLIVFNRILHDNIQLCFRLNYISNQFTLKAYDSTMNRIISNKKITDLIRKIANNNSSLPPSPNGRGRTSRSSCIVQVYSKSIPSTYLAISGYWDRILTIDPFLKNLFQKKRSLNATPFEKSMKSLLSNIASKNGWMYCNLDWYTESYYDSKNKPHNNHLLKQPLLFVNDVVNKILNNDLDYHYSNRDLFVCGERKVISFMQNDSLFLKKYRGQIDGIIFYIDRKPCYVCEESLKHFQSKLGIKWMKVNYAAD